MQDVNGLRGKSASRKQDTLQTDPQKQPGFLPIETNWFDRFFISVVLWVALSLFWFRKLLLRLNICGKPIANNYCEVKMKALWKESQKT